MSRSAIDSSSVSLLSPTPMSGIKGIQTFVTTRYGGCSRGTYSSFNCSPYCGDDPACVADNTKMLLTLLGGYPFPLILPHQVHDTVVRCIDTDFLHLNPDEQCTALEGVDALITDSSSCALCVSTADCLPVFFYDSVHRAVGMVHSGWRGTVGHIALCTLRAMQETYGTSPQEVRVAFGPCISQTAFEVGDEVYEAFASESFPMERIAVRYSKSGKWHISLQEAVRSDLQAAGVNDRCIELSARCTYTEHTDFFSARRLGISSGRILSGIFLTNS